MITIIDTDGKSLTPEQAVQPLLVDGWEYRGYSIYGDRFVFEVYKVLRLSYCIKHKNKDIELPEGYKFLSTNMDATELQNILDNQQKEVQHD